jgi:hypothetical protein
MLIVIIGNHKLRLLKAGHQFSMNTWNMTYKVLRQALKARTNPKAVEEDSEDLFVSKLIEKTLEKLSQMFYSFAQFEVYRMKRVACTLNRYWLRSCPKYPKLKLHTIADTNHYDILLEEVWRRSSCAINLRR